MKRGKKKQTNKNLKIISPTPLGPTIATRVSVSTLNRRFYLHQYIVYIYIYIYVKQQNSKTAKQQNSKTAKQQNSKPKGKKRRSKVKKTRHRC